MSQTPASPSNAKVLSASYLEKHSNRKDLVRRLRNVSNVLRDDPNVEADSSDYPGMAAMAACLVQEFLNHKDKEVRLYAVLCCMELFAVYAPEAPWSSAETCQIFKQTTRQLANLSHTTNPSQPNYQNYLHILELLASVKIGVVLVDLAKTAGNDLDDDLGDENPLEVLAELFQTTLQSLRPQHDDKVCDYVTQLINGCLEEYYGNVYVPLPLVEELLVCVGQGPTLFVANPAALQAAATNKKGKKGKKAPAVPLQLEKPNPSFFCASKIIRQNMDSLSTPVSNLLNGLINGEAHIVQRSSIAAEEDGEGGENNQGGADVWTIIYQLGKISPSILTTVLGTVTNCLTSEDGKRFKAVKLLGKLFYAKGSKLASKFGPCFRQWLNRYTDVNEEIRLFMVDSFVSIIKTNKDKTVIQACEHNLTLMLEYDREKRVRLKALEVVCDYAYEYNDDSNENPISINLLKAVGNRVQSKIPEERLKALTGMGQIYFHKYMHEVLSEIEEAGDDCDVELISRVLTENCNHITLFAKDTDDEEGQPSGREKYKFMARIIFQCLFFTDAADSDMRARVTTIIDDLMLGSDTSKNKRKQVSPMARVVGLAIVLDSLRNHGEGAFDDHSASNSFNFMLMFLRQKHALQKALSAYVDARSLTRGHRQGSEDAAQANQLAMQKLQEVALLLPKPSDEDVLESFHAAKDKRIFQNLGLLTDPSHTRATKLRALDELPKRAQSLGDDVKEWVETLVRRCSMGTFLNADVVQDSITWASACLSEDQVPAASALFAGVDVAINIFPSICGQPESFEALKSSFSSCLNTTANAKIKREVTQSGLLTCVTSVLPAVARASQVSKDTATDADEYLDKVIRKQLLQLCTKDGTPQQARNAVATLATLFTSPKKSGGEPIDAQAFSWLLKELTSPSKMSVDADGKDAAQVVSILSALSALVEQAPAPFGRSSKGESAVKFALEKVLLGRGAGNGSADDSDSDSVSDETPKKKAGKKKGAQHRSPVARKSLLENSDLSVACRRICAAIEFLAQYVKSTILASKAAADEGGNVSVPSAERLRGMFDLLSQTIRDNGVPPSKRDRTLCRTRQDRAAIRQCAGVHLLRLCATRLQLEHKFLTTKMWHILGGIVVDEEFAVRDVVIEELTAMMKGVGWFSHDLPPLRLVALIALCVDGETRAASSAANGNAANVGSHRTNAAKMAAVRCYGNLRQAWKRTVGCEDEVNEEEDESNEELKALFTPENVVPFAFHLLSFRRETPTEEDEKGEKASKTQVILKKRLKLLFQPLVQSLGNSPDNVSFLLRMTRVLHNYDPIDLDTALSSSIGALPSSGASVVSDEEISPNKSAAESNPTAQAKLEVVCSTAFAFINNDLVKNADDLVTHPGDIRLPAFLFRKSANKKRAKTGKAGSKKRPVPEEVFLSDGETEKAEAALGSPVSPILKSGSPGSGAPSPTGILNNASPQLSSEEEKTLSPGLTERETPASSRAPKATQGSEANRCTQSVEATPDTRVKWQADESPSTLGEEGIGKKQATKKQNKNVPSQIQVDDQESPSPIRRNSTRKGSIQRVKPLGDSNRAPKDANKRRKRSSNSPTPEPKRSARRSPRLRA